MVVEEAEAEREEADKDEAVDKEEEEEDADVEQEQETNGPATTADQNNTSRETVISTRLKEANYGVVTVIQPATMTGCASSYIQKDMEEKEGQDSIVSSVLPTRKLHQQKASTQMPPSM